MKYTERTKLHRITYSVLSRFAYIIYQCREPRNPHDRWKMSAGDIYIRIGVTEEFLFVEARRWGMLDKVTQTEWPWDPLLPNCCFAVLTSKDSPSRQLCNSFIAYSKFSPVWRQQKCFPRNSFHVKRFVNGQEVSRLNIHATTLLNLMI